MKDANSQASRPESGNSAFYEKLDRMLKWIDRDPGAAARDLQVLIDQTDETARNSIYVAATMAYRLAERVHDDDNAWKSFRENAFWNGHSEPKQDEALRNSLMFVYGGHQGQKAERARDYARAMRSSWKDHVSARRVFEILMEDGGFAGLKKKTSGQVKVKAGAAIKRVSLIVDEERLARITALEDDDVTTSGSNAFGCSGGRP